ncbi:cortical protein KAR9-domain-containing protein [Emericellopsis atlantica]|uniref:Cortical protein KAR9-domain-containing protein n=1 Tax=Emericellopsis atlantica TaxID=2614577 RepID=A0A9P8CSE4_9HYPO|nr:cortical protein KAR9-domain-containing protein [Emericellopsis atlantica]KAG9257999.1 cortical protein KAR9-domain-containing protein [Emericellopsis atlantica]
MTNSETGISDLDEALQEPRVYDNALIGNENSGESGLTSDTDPLANAAPTELQRTDVSEQRQVCVQSQPQLHPTAHADTDAAASKHRQDHNAATLLTFSDVSSDLSHLPFNSSASDLGVTASSSLPTLHNNTSRRPASRSSSSHSTTRHDSLWSTPNVTLAATPSTSRSAIRKPSPGLAARLKALGFGTGEKPSTTTTTAPLDSIGRLNEDQLRELDEKLQQGSTKSVVVRRGRPWKGAGALTIFSRKPDLEENTSDSLVDGGASCQLEQSQPQLPDIELPEPLAMDTQKYRLPDHANGNGTKSIPEVRREHIERDTQPPPVAREEPDKPPTPPPKETLPPVTPPSTSASNDFTPGLGSYFTPGHNRPGSIYTLSRASFANQLAQLTSLQLPDAGSLSEKVSAIPTATVAAKALINAADQIRSWISKASEVISGLDSDDDVEWSAAGGREGLTEVENAIVRFEDLINVYVGAIERLQSRKDIQEVPAEDLRRAVSQMEAIVGEWSSIRSTLHNVRGQVEIAMEWEELWNNVLGDIQSEMDELARLVFEMEERRHKSIAAAAAGDGVDIGDLETIIEDTPPQITKSKANNRLSIPLFSMSPGSPGAPNTPGAPTLSQDDSSLLALFARMQPLRASLDFLPMRLSVFQTRAEHAFPTACEELEMRRTGLDASYKKLEKDAESLRKELGEDRWVIVFRGAGRQAQKMHESVERSLAKLREAMDAEPQMTSPALIKKLESYEAKKTHYGPAIERVLSIIDKGVKDRITVNGEILRLHLDLEARWSSLKEQTREMDAACEELHAERKSQQLRDSVSTMLSSDRSPLGSSQATPGSSPPSSEIMTSLGVEPYAPHSQGRSGNTRNDGVAYRRQSSLPAPAYAAKRGGASRLATVSSSSSTTPRPASQIQRPSSTLGYRPRWNTSTNTSSIDTGHHFKPLSLTTPSPYAKNSPHAQRSVSSFTPGSTSTSKLPMYRSPLSRATSESPKVDETPTRTGHSRLSFRERLTTPKQHQPMQQPRLAVQGSNASVDSAGSSTSSNRRASFQPPRALSSMEEAHPSRPASSLASTSRRTSLLPQAKPTNTARRESSTGRASPQALTASRLAMRRKEAPPKDNKPVWRH